MMFPRRIVFGVTVGARLSRAVATPVICGFTHHSSEER
jgi:hypothetical protein